MTSDRRLPFELAELQVFLAVCETKTMVKAARLHGLTQPAVSHVILDMERRLGVQLFDRSIRPIGLTPAGIILYEHASALMTEARHIETLLQRSQRGQLPILRVGLVDSMNRVLSVALLSTLSKAAVQVVVQTGLVAAHTSALLTRQLDLVVGVDGQAEARELTEIAGLERRRLVEEPYVILTPRAATPPDLATLARESPLIRYSARSRTGSDIERYLTSIGVNAARGVQFDAPFGVTASVVARMGWAITTPLCIMESAIPIDGCSVFPLPPPGFKRSLIMVSRAKELGSIPRDAAATATSLLRQRCKEGLKDLPPWVLAAMSFSAR